MKLESVLITKIIIYYVVSSITNNTSDSSSHHYILLGQKSWAGRGGVCVVVISLLQKDKMIWRNDSDWFVSHSSDKASLQSRRASQHLSLLFIWDSSQQSVSHLITTTSSPVIALWGSGMETPDSVLAKNEWWPEDPGLHQTFTQYVLPIFTKKKTSCKFGINLSVASN